MYHYLFNLLCFQFKVVSIPYFMDECTQWELNDIVENLPYMDRNMWEAARLNAYIVAQVNSKKTLKMQDICKFKWDEDESKNIEISNSDIERLKEKARRIQNEHLQHRTI